MGETRSGSSPRRIQVRPPSWVIQSSTVAGPFGPASSIAYWSLNLGLATSSVPPPPSRAGDWRMPVDWSGPSRPTAAQSFRADRRRPPRRGPWVGRSTTGGADRATPGGAGSRSQSEPPARLARRGGVRKRHALIGRIAPTPTIVSGWRPARGFTGVKLGPAVISGLRSIGDL